MTTPKSNLLCAKWAYPDGEWFVNVHGGVANAKTGAYFDITYKRDLQSVTRKLESEHGWKIRKASGQWRAEKHGEWHERPILEDLVVLMVGRVKK
jgi:hypothetical protein